MIENENDLFYFACWQDNTIAVAVLVLVCLLAFGAVGTFFCVKFGQFLERKYKCKTK